MNNQNVIGQLYNTASSMRMVTLAAHPIQFFTSATERVRIDPSGNVGIGTTAPSSLVTLHVSGTTTTPLRIDGTSSSYLNFFGGGSARGLFGYAAVGSGGLGFVNAAGTTVNALFTDNGRLGIGTTTPGSSLEVSGGSITLRGGYNATTRLIFNPSGTAGEEWEWYPDVNGIALYNRTDAVSRLYVQNNGNVIITGLSSSCTIGNGLGATNCTSDARLKERIVPITGALDKLMLIKGVTFHWKKPSISGPEHLGLLAQDVEKVFPQAVDTVSDSTIGTAKTLDYAVLVAPIIEAMRELKVAQDSLASKTTALEAAGANSQVQFNDGGSALGGDADYTWNKATNKLTINGDIDYTGLLTDTSDWRQKTDIQDFPGDALERVMLLKPVSFRMKQGRRDIEYGFIAQDVRPLFPELVRGDDMLSLNYIGLMAPMVKAMQEMNTKVDILSEQNRQLRESLHDLGADLKNLRKAAARSQTLH